MKPILISLSTADNPLRDIKSYELALLRFNYYCDLPRSLAENKAIIENKMTKALEESVLDDIGTQSLYDAKDADTATKYLVLCILNGYTESSNPKISKLIKETLKKYPKAAARIDNISGWDEEDNQLDLLSTDENSSIGDLLYVLKSDKASNEMKINALHHKNANKIAYAYAEKYGSSKVKEEAIKLLGTLKDIGAYVSVKSNKIYIKPEWIDSMLASKQKHGKVDFLFENYLVLTSDSDGMLASHCKRNLTEAPQLTKLIGIKMYAGIWR